MKNIVKILLISVLLLLIAAAVIYCVRSGYTVSENFAYASETSLDTEKVYERASLLISETESLLESGNTGTVINLSDAGSSVAGSGASVSEDGVVITGGGYYTIEGSLSDGCITVDSDNNIVLILNGASVSNTDEPAVNIENSLHTLIYTVENTENTIATVCSSLTAGDGNSSGAAVFSKSDLSLSGKGTLNVYGNYHNGISSSDSLMILGGDYSVSAAYNGIRGKDYVYIESGTINITCENDGIKTDSESSGSLYGNIIIAGGDITVESGGDGIQADNDLAVISGNINIISGGGNSSSGEKENGGFEMPGIFEINTESFTDIPELPDMENQKQFNVFESNTDFQSITGNFSPDSAVNGGIPSDMNPGGGNMPAGMVGGMKNSGNTETLTDVNPGSDDNRNFMKMPSGSHGYGISTGTDITRGAMNHSGKAVNGTQTPTDFTPGQNRQNSFEISSENGGYSGFFSSESGNETSSKGLKSSGGTISVSGGNINISSSDDGIHSNDTVTVSGGTLVISSGDDGIHADAAVTISGGSINISDSCEGIEANSITVSGGDISLASTDDGFNANGGTSGFGMIPGFNKSSGESGSDMSVLKITGGNIYVLAGGDGIDSNGDIIIEGGNIIVDGPSTSANGAIDYGSESGGTCTISGGTVMAVGASGMAESFDDSSQQGSILLRLSENYDSGSSITVTDSSGAVIFEHTAAKSFSSVVFSSPEITAGNTYTVSVNGDSYEITMETISYSNFQESGFMTNTRP